MEKMFKKIERKFETKFEKFEGKMAAEKVEFKGKGIERQKCGCKRFAAQCGQCNICCCKSGGCSIHVPLEQLPDPKRRRNSVFAIQPDPPPAAQSTEMRAMRTEIRDLKHERDLEREQRLSEKEHLTSEHKSAEQKLQKLEAVIADLQKQKEDEVKEVKQEKFQSSKFTGSNRWCSAC